jgi:hypothetical protein
MVLDNFEGVLDFFGGALEFFYEVLDKFSQVLVKNLSVLDFKTIFPKNKDQSIKRGLAQQFIFAALL